MKLVGRISVSEREKERVEGHGALSRSSWLWYSGVSGAITFVYVSASLLHSLHDESKLSPPPPAFLR